MHSDQAVPLCDARYFFASAMISASAFCAFAFVFCGIFFCETRTCTIYYTGDKKNVFFK